MSFFYKPRRAAVLIETLIAMALLAIAMTALARFAATGMEESAGAQQRTLAAFLAQEKTEEIMQARNDLEAWFRTAEGLYPLDEDGLHRRFEPESLEAFRWNWEIRRYDPHPGMGVITVSVFPPSPGRGGDRGAFTLSTLLFLPDNMLEGEPQ